MVPKHFFPSHRFSVLNSVVALTFGALALSGCGQEAATPSEQSAPAVQGKPVKILKMNASTLESQRELSGRTHAYAEAEIRPQVTGVIEKRLFEEGMDVKSGQALYQIASSEYVARVDSAKAELDRAEATAEIARQNEKRFAQLIESKAVSQQEYDEVVATRKQTEADIAVRRATLTQARIDLSRTKVTSPIDGRIGRSSVTAGALVTQNQQNSLARVLQLDPIYVDLAASSSDVLQFKRDVQAGRLQTNANEAVPVTILYEDGTAHNAKGQLAFSEISVDESSGTVILRAIVPNPDHLLMPGMYVKAQLSAGLLDNAILAPQSAVSRTPRGDPYALVMNEQGVAEQRMLKLAGASNNNWIVEDGLKSGDNLIVDGLLMLREGMPVQPINSENDAMANAEATTPSQVSEQ